MAKRAPDKDLTQVIQEMWQSSLMLDTPGREQRNAFLNAMDRQIRPVLYRFVLTLGYGQLAKSEAADITQETLYKFYCKVLVENIDVSQHHVMPWLYTVARNHFKDRVKASEKITPLADEATEEFDSPDYYVNRRVNEAIAELSERRRRVALALGDECKHSEIAAELGIPLTTVRADVKVIKQHLKKRLKGDV